MNQLLSDATLKALKGRARLPDYDRHTLPVGQLHLGLGAFHRAHQALYTDTALGSVGGPWGVAGVSLRSPGVRNSLSPQDFLYSVTEQDNEDRHYRVIGCLVECLVAPEDPAAVIARLAAEATQVVTLTITEKGYCLTPEGRLDLSQADISADSLSYPRSAIGYLVAGLRARRDSGQGGLTLLSCDNLADNGDKLESAVRDLAARLAPDLPDWIERHCRFPSSMVDRIVPATTDRDRAAVAAALGVEDAAAVVTEPFSQWVIESDFAGPVPDWDRAGAQFVDDVAPFETMKLRLLNASHSAIAYLGCLAGYETVAEAMAAPGMRALLEQLMAEEMTPSLPALGEFDLHRYREALLARFANRGLAHRCAQIAMDGSQKIPQRILPALRWQLERAGPIDASSLVLAAWLRFLQGADDAGRPTPVDDPLAQELRGLASRHSDNTGAYVHAVIARLDASLAASDVLRTRVQQYLVLLATEGAAAVLSRWGAVTKK